eukprot:gene11756-5094_t
MKINNVQVISDSKGKKEFSIDETTTIEEFKEMLRKEFHWENVNDIRLTLEQRELKTGSVAENGISHGEKYLYASPMKPGGKIQ